MVAVVISCVFGLIIIIQAMMHRSERKDLYNRIMSKDYHEYKGEQHKPVITAHRKRLTEWRKKEGDGK